MRQDFDPIPIDAEAVLDPGWIHAAFALDPDTRVINVEPGEALKTVADKLRFRVDLSGPGGDRSLHCCAKAHFGADAPGTLVTEAHCYAELLPPLAVRVPRIHYNAVDDETDRAIFVMDDVEALGGRFMNAHDPYAVDLAAETLAQLALLHASTWADQRWATPTWLQPRFTMAEMFPPEYLQTLLDDGRGPDVPAELRDAANLVAAMQRTAQLPGTCVIHADPHSGNCYLDADGAPHWLDWQITQWGSWSVDVAYHLGTVLTIGDRRASERDLIEHYLGELRSHGVDAPDDVDGFDLYASSFAWGWFLWTITTISSRAVVLEHVPRLAAALDDHGTLDRLGI
ncbi:MAG: hypothetical protein AAF548_06500 [Actinomycetota bacterium]